MSYQEHEKTIQETLNYIEQHLKDDLPLQTLAKHAGYSRFHFHRIFKKVIKKSVVDYIRERRMTQAAKDLIHTNKGRSISHCSTVLVHRNPSLEPLRRYMICHPHVIGDY